MNKFKGSGVALVTPFQTDGSIDFNALKKLVSLQINGGTDFLVVQGTTGESPTLSQDEKRAVLETVLEVNNGQLPLVYGIGGNNIGNFCQFESGFYTHVRTRTARYIIENNRQISVRSDLLEMCYNALLNGFVVIRRDGQNAINTLRQLLKKTR